MNLSKFWYVYVVCLCELLIFFCPVFCCFQFFFFLQQVSQTLSLWFYILIDNMNEEDEVSWAQNLLSSDISYVVMIYELVENVLDPCSFVTTAVSTVEKLYNVPQSIITQQVSIFFSLVGRTNIWCIFCRQFNFFFFFILFFLTADSTEVTNELSKLSTDLTWTDEFYLFIENVIAVSGALSHYPDWTTTATVSGSTDENNTERRRRLSGASSTLITQDLLFLIEDSLYIHELASLSLSIPTESYSFDLTNFGVYIARVDNETINTTIGNTTVIISNEDTNGGSDDLGYVDVIVVTMPGNDDETNYVDGGQTLHIATSTDCGNDIAIHTNSSTITNGTGNITSDTVDITITSNNTAIHNITEDIVIIFENVDFGEGDEDDAQEFCVWFDEQDSSWNSDGCRTEIFEEESRIICYCSHLTKFAVMSTLSESNNQGTGCPSGNNNLSDELGISEYRLHLCVFFIICFLFIVTLVFYKMKVLRDMKLLHKYKDKKESFHALIISGICGFLEAVGSSLFVFYAQDSNLKENDVYIEILTLILGLPLLLYFIMFTQALQGWMTVADSLHTKSVAREQLKKHFFNGVNISVSFLFLNLIVLLLLDIDQNHTNFFLYGEVSWLALMSIACISFMIYSVKLRHVLYSTLQRVVNVQDEKSLLEQKKIIKRLTIVSILLTLFFTLQTLIGVYGVYIQSSGKKYDVSLTMVNMLLNLMYLSSFLYLYIPNINRIIHSERKSYVNHFDMFFFKVRMAALQIKTT